MQRRQALQQLFSGLAAGSLLGPVAAFAQNQPAQQPVGRVQLGQPATAAVPAAGQLGQRPQANLAVAPEVAEALRRWERYTRNIQRLHGAFERYVYDSTFMVEYRAEGEFWYENPDQARIDLEPSQRLPPANDNGVRLNPRKLGANGQPFSVQADMKSRWICRGDALLQIDDDKKEFHVLDIPPHLRGQNITKSPLPFLFGVNAAAMEERYFLTAGQLTNYQGKPTLHLVAGPRLRSDAAEWQRAEVLLDTGNYFKDNNGEPIYVPMAIKLLDPSGQKETVYVFFPDRTKLNQSLLWGNPFKDPGLLSGYKMGSRQTIALDPDERSRTVENDGANPSQQTR